MKKAIKIPSVRYATKDNASVKPSKATDKKAVYGQGTQAELTARYNATAKAGKLGLGFGGEDIKAPVTKNVKGKGGAKKSSAISKLQSRYVKK